MRRKHGHSHLYITWGSLLSEGSVSYHLCILGMLLDGLVWEFGLLGPTLFMFLLVMLLARQLRPAGSGNEEVLVPDMNQLILFQPYPLSYLSNLKKNQTENVVIPWILYR